MKSYSKTVAVLILLVFGALASESAMARGGHGGGGHGGGGHFGGGFRGGGVGFGIALGVPLYGLGYYSGYYPYPAYAYPPAYGYPGPAVAPSGAYAEQGYAQGYPQGYPQAAPAPAQPQGDWYFCPNSNAYYPYVRECPNGWQRVPAQPSH
jgi:hypothetical protein